MNAELYEILSAVKPTYHMILPANIGEGIVYQLADAHDIEYEGGAPLAEVYTYQVALYQNAYDGGVVNALCSALRAAGWAIVGRIQMEQQDGTTKYYQHVIETRKGSVFS